jgi:hypothetical protein
MRAGIVAIFFFAALLALGHYVAAPFFCRGGIAIPSLDPRALCGADFHLNRSGSVLLYFGSIAAALLFGVIAVALPDRNKSAAKEKSEAKPAETFEQIVASEEKKQPAATPPAAATADASKAATTAAPATTSASTPAAPVEEAGPSRSTAEAAQAAIVSAIASPASPQKTGPAATALVPSPESVAMAEAITVGLSVTKSAARGSFDGTNEELLERFRELKKQEGVNSIAQAQRLLDESTLSALSKGIDPKQHLSQVAHLVLAEDPDLKSSVVRGVVVHVAARLKELGVVQKIPNPAKGAA